MRLYSVLGFSASANMGFSSEVLVYEVPGRCTLSSLHKNFVTTCPYLGEPHEPRILAADGLHHALHGFQLTKVFQNYHLARDFLNWDRREGLFCEMFLPEMQ